MGKDDSRQKILDSACPIFASKGYQGTTIREICDAAGVNLASVNYYFGGKEQLYSEILDQLPPLKSERDRPLPEMDDSIPPEEQLRVVIRTILERVLSHDHPDGWQFQLLHRELAQPTPIGEERIKLFFVTNYERVINLLAQLCPEGTSRSRLLQIAFSTVSQCLFYGPGRHVVHFLIDPETEEKDFSIEPICEHITSFVFAGLGLAPSPFAVGESKTVGEDNRDTLTREEVKP